MNDPYITKLEKLSDDFEKNKNKLTQEELIKLVGLVIRLSITREKANRDAENLARILKID